MSIRISTQILRENRSISVQMNLFKMLTPIVHYKIKNPQILISIPDYHTVKYRSAEWQPTANTYNKSFNATNYKIRMVELSEKGIWMQTTGE